MTLVQSIAARLSPSYARKAAGKVKKDYNAFDRQYGWAPKKVMEYLHTVRSGIGFHAYGKDPIIDLNIEKIAHESSEVMLSEILCKNTNDVKDIDSTMGLYGLSMYSGIPLKEMGFYAGGYVETPYEKGKSIATTVREFLFKNNSGYVESIQNRFGKSGEMILDAYKKCGAVLVQREPLSSKTSYYVCDDFVVEGKRYYGMAALEKASQIMLNSYK